MNMAIDGADQCLLLAEPNIPTMSVAPAALTTLFSSKVNN
jgi:hypothetical protein